MSRWKSIIIILLIALLTLTALLAASLNTLELLPGQPFRVEEAAGAASGLKVNPELMAWVLRGFLWLMIIVTPFGIFFMARTKEGRRRLAALAGVLIAITVLGEIADRTRPPTPLEEESSPIVAIPPVGEMESQSFQDLPPLVAPAPPPGWMPPATTFILALFLAGAAALIYWLFLRPPRPASDLEELAEEIQEAIDDLEVGADLRQTVIRCYWVMNRVVQRSMGLHREEAATPREFERTLIKQGLPSQEVGDLTRLFEAARYGERMNNPADKTQAIACLKQIMNACRKPEAVYENRPA